MNLDEFAEIVNTKTKGSFGFKPSEVDITKFNDYEEEREFSSTKLKDNVTIPPTTFDKLDCDREVIAIDGTSFTLGVSEDGAIGAVRCAAIIKKGNSTKVEVRRFGPIIGHYTLSNKQGIYSELQNKIFGNVKEVKSPICSKMPDRIRNFLEKFIQMKIIKENEGAIVLVDGGLIADDVDNNSKFMTSLINEAKKNNIDIVAISKRSDLSIENNNASIHSIIRNKTGPIFADVRPYLEEPHTYRYLGEVYTVKFSPSSACIPFRVDIPKDSTEPHTSILSKIASLTCRFGYPDELRVAHIACKLDAVEILELQAAACNLFNMHIEEDIRTRILGPLG